MKTATTTFTKSWIAPQLDWDQREGRVALDLPYKATGLVELLAKGHLLIPECWSQAPGLIFNSRHGVWGNLGRGFHALNPPADWCRREDRLPLYLHGLYAQTDAYTERVLVILSFDEPTQCPLPEWPQWQATAKAAWDAYLQQVKALQERLDAQQQEDHAWLAAQPPERRRELARGRDVAEAIFGEREPPVAEPVLRSLLDAQVSPTPIRFGLWVPGNGPRRPRVRDIRSAIQSSRLRASRDGGYTVITAADDDGRPGAVVSWQPGTELPSFPELRAAAARLLPKSFDKPRRIDVSPPYFDGDSTAGEPQTIADLSDITTDIDTGDLPSLRDWRFDPSPERAAQGRVLVQRGGIEAIGWYQPFHTWSDDAWGIYLHSDRLHDVASALQEDLARRARGHAPVLAAFLAVALVYFHECFHARIEAAATFLEVQSRGGRYLRYKREVYVPCSGLPSWLEEALANWWALASIRQRLEDWGKQGLVRDREAVTRVVEDYLDLSPPGYRHWRQGGDTSVWRTMASEIAMGRPGGAVRGLTLPVDSLLVGAPGFDWRSADVPTRFVGRGVIADRFFAAPKRKDAEALLKDFGYACDAKRGKGSHDVWSGPDGRSFPLTHRDPLSVHMFHELLRSLDISKQEYVEHVRLRLSERVGSRQLLRPDPAPLGARSD